MTTLVPHRPRRPARLVAFTMLLTLLALVGAACGGDNKDGATGAADQSVTTDRSVSDDPSTTTTTTAPATDDDSTTASSGGSGTTGSSSCKSVSAKDVEGILGEAVTESPDLAAAMITNPTVRDATDEACAFSTASTPGTLAAFIQRSDDAQAWAYIDTILRGSNGAKDVTPVEGLGDQALTNESGGVGFMNGQDATLVLVVGSSADQSTDRALALAHLLAG